MSYGWFLLVPAALVAAPQLVTRSSSGDPLFGDAPWINHGVRVAAFCTFCVFALYLFLQSKA